MEFFENKKVENLVQKHIEKTYKLEEKEARFLLKKYKEVRVELADRLVAVNQGTGYRTETGRESFTAQQMRGVLVQLDTAIQAMEHRLLTGMTNASAVMSNEGTDQLIKEINTFNSEFVGAIVPIDIDKVLVTRETTALLFNKYESSLKAYSTGVRQQLVSGLTNSLIEQASYPEVITRLGKYFMQEEWKLHRIARTELHNIYNIAKQKGMEETREKYIPDLKKSLFHPMDHRTGEDSKQADKKNLVVDIDKPFSYTYVRYNKDGTRVEEKRVFFTPPDRCNDRSIMVPYREEWDV